MSIRLSVLRYADGVLTLSGSDGTTQFSHPAAQVAILPMSGSRFALTVDGQTYVLCALSLRGFTGQAARHLATRCGATLIPPGIGPTGPYLRWVTHSVSQYAAPAQRTLWQRYLLRLLTEAGATRLPGVRWKQVDEPDPFDLPARRVPGVVQVVWMLLPLVSLGVLAWITYLYAAIRARRRWLWVCAAIVIVLDGIYYWTSALLGSNIDNTAAGSATAGLMAVLALLGSFYAWQMRHYVFHRGRGYHIPRVGLRQAYQRPPVDKRHTCPVCGFPYLHEPPYDPTDVPESPSYEICPSCGFEFGHSEGICSIAEWRTRWLDKGMPWSSSTRRPDDWDPLAQLGNLPDAR